MAQRDYHKKFKAVFEKAVSPKTSAPLTQREAAEIMTRESYDDPTDERTVRRYLAQDRNSKGARRCPGWAVRILEIGLKEMRK